MYISRIITDSEIDCKFFFIDVVNTKYKDEYDIPTLIIGKNNAIERFGKENIKILDNKIRENVFWTYSKYEKRHFYEKNLKDFIQFSIKTFINKINYKFINILNCGYNELKNILNLLYSKEEKFIYYNNGLLYIHNSFNVIGISIKDISYIGINKSKVKKIILSNTHNHIIKWNKDVWYDYIEILKDKTYLYPIVMSNLKK